MSKTPSISFVLGSYNRRLFVEETINSIRAEAVGLDHEIIVVDGGSTDGAVEWLLAQKDVITIVQHNRGVWNGTPLVPRSWGYFMNLAFRNAAGRVICMVSDDCLLVPGTIRAALAAWSAAGSQVGAMPFYWRNGGDLGQYFVSVYGGVPFVNHGFYAREALAAVGFADEETFVFYAGDIDLCLKIQTAGYRIVPCTEALVEHWPHLPGDTRPFNEAKMARDFQALKTKWRQVAEWADPDRRIEMVYHQVATPPDLVDRMRRVERTMARREWPRALWAKVRRRLFR